MIKKKKMKEKYISRLIFHSFFACLPFLTKAEKKNKKKILYSLNAQHDDSQDDEQCGVFKEEEKVKKKAKHGR